jgi:hypothetical protein
MFEIALSRRPVIVRAASNVDRPREERQRCKLFRDRARARQSDPYGLRLALGRRFLRVHQHVEESEGEPTRCDEEGGLVWEWN